MIRRFFSVLSFACVALFSSNAQDPVVMTIAGEDVYKSEFEYIYNKNNTVSTSDRKSLDEYVELFVNYKLKVAEAKRQGYDTREQYTKEYEQYRLQLSAPYLKDEETENEIIEEAFERYKTSILTSHILIKFSEDSTEAWKTINDIYNRLKQGEDFATLAKQYSECPSKENGGSLGYVNVFDMVYDFENVVYSTPIGTISKPFRTRFGYHIVKTFDKIENYKDWRISHIMIKNDGSKSADKADSIFSLAKKGMDFEKLVADFSEDVPTKSKGGDLGFVSKGYFPPQITSQVKLLKHVGDIGMAGTAFGYHIIKVTEIVPFTNIEDLKPYIKSKLAKSDRMEITSEKFMKKLQSKYGVSVYENALTIFEKLVDEPSREGRENLYRLMTEPLYTLYGNVYPQSAFYPYMNKRLPIFGRGLDKDKKVINFIDTKQEGVREGDEVYIAFNGYILNEIVEQELEYVKNTNSDYRNLLKEYSDGLLLFEISSDKVWNVASSSGKKLEEYFEAHKDKYVWSEPRYKGMVVSCANKDVYDRVEKILKTNTEAEAEDLIRKEFLNNKVSLVKIEKGVFPKGVNLAVDDKIYQTATYSSSAYPFVSTRGAVISAPQTYMDVKGLVTADYQTYLEEEWVKQLRKKYDVIINKEVLKTIK